MFIFTTLWTENKFTRLQEVSSNYELRIEVGKHFYFTLRSTTIKNLVFIALQSSFTGPSLYHCFKALV
jgi:hypothetical protein